MRWDKIMRVDWVATLSATIYSFRYDLATPVKMYYCHGKQDHHSTSIIKRKLSKNDFGNVLDSMNEFSNSAATNE